MQKVLHPAEGRGKGDHGWLTTRYSFSFADWHDATRMGFGTLRVINDDVIAPASGFGQHGHRDMEIITVVTRGAVSHEDSMGNREMVPAGDVQVMSAGTGVVHAERNDSSTEPLTLFQIWIEARELGIAPRYAQKSFELEKAQAGLTLLVSPEGRGGSLAINQDAFLYQAVLDAAHPIPYTFSQAGSGVYIFVIEGSVVVDGQSLGPRDALGVWDTKEISITTLSSARLLLIEVPMK